ncbi:MAG TPA: tRNA (adenosine(37)-N6)-threonylcarbamoyltransferase complex ATPase subunit type 1 TsaE [Arenicellales bacterium]|nr:tRNA (adenosine(37)-N6)-threonylcarbamoyltransferase complex ATPase subunit type 1 TsaE [Arenicellales bacterium]
MQIESVYHVDSEEKMEAFGAALAGRIESGCVIYLSGDLGAGKTTLVRGLLRALGHDGVVTSPTFTLLEVYQTGRMQVVHMDLYRLEEPEELEVLALRDYLGAHTVLLVEWAERARDRLPGPDCEVRIVIEPDDRREVTIQSFTHVGERLCTV